MARRADYAIVRLDAHASRGERLNVGLLVFNETGVDIRLARRLDKVKAISGALDVELLRENILSIYEIDASLRADGIVASSERRDALHNMGFASLSALATFECATSLTYETVVAKLLESIVEPEPAPIKAQLKRTRLLAAVKQALRHERILGKAGDDLANHQIVPDVKLAEGLIADLVLRNGAMHVVETVDASADESARLKVIKQIGLSALVLEQARIHYGENETHARLIYDASSALENLAMPSLRAAEHQGAELINWRSNEDRVRFLIRLSELAVPSLPVKKNTAPRFVPTSQHRLKLN